MKILHTADWHIGRMLYGRKRYEEFEAFLDWLTQMLKEEQVDILLVSGDVFDTTTPSNRAQKLYYRFLCGVVATGCTHVVVTGGNHDSPSFLNAPKELLSSLNVHVVGSKTESAEDEVFVLDLSGKPALIVGAVPYLRDRDIRAVEAGESFEQKNLNLIQGIKDHYAAVVAVAVDRQGKLAGADGDMLPIVAMGHLFAAGGATVEGDGVRDLYVGTLAHVGPEVFPKEVDYLALGHLHVPQKVGGLEHMRYSGSPIPMGYGEASQQKQVLLLEFENRIPVVRTLPVPCFQEFKRMEGALDEILLEIEKLKKAGSGAWLEIEYTGDSIVSDLHERIITAVHGTGMEIRRIKNRQVFNRVLQQQEEQELLEDLNVGQVFQRLLDAAGIEEETRDELQSCYREIVTLVQEQDVREE